MRRSLAAIAVLASLHGAPGAAAETRKRAAILDVVTEGLADDVRRQFETLVEEGLRKVGYDVVDHTTTFDAISRKELAEGCTFGPCVAPIARAVKADRLIDVRLGAVGQSYTFVLSMLEGQSGATLSQVVGSCPVCTVAEALTKVRAAIEVLDSQASAMSTPLVTRDAGRARHRSKTLPAVALVAGLAAAAGGAAMVHWSGHDAPGWVTIGAGGAVAMTGLIFLFGD